MDALQFVNACLDRTTLTNSEIARGSGLTEQWLRAYRKGEITDPGYSRIKRLSDFFQRVGEEPVLKEHQSVPQQAAGGPPRRQM